MKRTAREEAFFVQNLEAAGDGGKGKEMESGKKILVILKLKDPFCSDWLR